MIFGSIRAILIYSRSVLVMMFTLIRFGATAHYYCGGEYSASYTNRHHAGCTSDDYAA
jgi:hypothetical protein